MCLLKGLSGVRPRAGEPDYPPSDSERPPPSFNPEIISISSDSDEQTRFYYSILKPGLM